MVIVTLRWTSKPSPPNTIIAIIINIAGAVKANSTAAAALLSRRQRRAQRPKMRLKGGNGDMGYSFMKTAVETRRSVPLPWVAKLNRLIPIIGN